MSAGLEEAKKLLYEKVVKTFTVEQVAKHKNLGIKNLIEHIGAYPN